LSFLLYKKQDNNMFIWLTSTHYRESPNEPEHDYYLFILPMDDEIWQYKIYNYPDESLNVSDDWNMRVTNFNRYPKSIMKFHIDEYHLERVFMTEELQKIVLKYCFREDSIVGKS